MSPAQIMDSVLVLIMSIKQNNNYALPVNYLKYLLLQGSISMFIAVSVMFIGVVNLCNYHTKI